MPNRPTTSSQPGTLLSEEGELFRIIYDSVSDAIVILDPVTARALSVNRAASEMFGYTLEEFQRLEIVDVSSGVAPFTQAEALIWIARAAAGQPQSIEWQGRSKSGRVFWVEANLRFITFQERGLLIVSVRDIDKRKHAEEELRSSESRYRQLSVATEQSPASVVITNPRGDIEYVNRKFEMVTGYSRSEAIGKNPRILKSGNLPAEVYEHLWKTILSGKEWRGEFYNRKKSGECYWEMASINPILNEMGEITHFLAVKEDITERKQAEADIRESEERFRLITTAIEDVFWLTTPAMDQMLYVSPAYAQIWGQPVQALYDSPKSFLESVHPDDIEKVLVEFKRKMTGQPFVIEYRIVRPDGAIRWIKDRGYPVKDAAGQVTRYAGIAQDTTEARKLEERFLRAQRMESIGILAGGIAHDLNNILAPILMGCELLSMELPEAKRREMLSSMQACAERGSEIVKQVLSFARGTEGRRVHVQPLHLIKDVGKIADETFPKNIRIFLRLDSPLMEISCDPTQIHQVLLNLCVNARDAMPLGGELTLSASSLEIDEQFASMQPGARPGSYVVIKVTDTGTGIAPELIGKIFDPFFTTKEVGKGTGLGLSTVLGIVNSHGGFVNAYSEPGKGSTFRVYLPAAGTGIRPAAAQESGAERPIGNGETILVVEDEPLILSTTRHVLEKHGYRVLAARDGAEGVAVYIQNQKAVAAILMDMMMPVMGGLATILAIQRADPGVKVIATSGLWSKEQVASVNATGVTRILLKPYKTEVLLTTLNNLLQEKTGPSRCD